MKIKTKNHRHILIFNKINIIISNVIYNCTNGILFEGSDNFGPLSRYLSNKILFNIIYYNKTGISSKNKFICSNNLFAHNIITNNFSSGIVFSNFDGNTITSNLIKGNKNGIYIGYGHNNIIYSNQLSYNTNGITLINVSNTILHRNIMEYNKYGIIVTNSPSTIFELNNVKDNQYGVWFKSGTNSVFVKNNIYNNNVYNARQPVDIDDFVYTNNWWGSTIWSNIRKKIEGTPPYINFAPWRLFGPFNIKESADTEPVSQI